MEWFRLTQEAPWLQVCCPDEVQRALVQRVWRNLPHIAPTNTLGSDSRDTVEQISSVMVAQVLEVGVINSMYKASLRKRSSCAPRDFLGHEHGFDTKPGQSQRHINVSPKAKQAEAPPTDAFMVASQIVNSAIDKGVVRTICPRRDSFQGDYASLANIIVNEAIRAGIKRAMQAFQDGSDSERVLTRITSHLEEKKQTESPVHFAIAREIMEAAVEAGVVRALTPFDEDEFQSPAAELQKITARQSSSAFGIFPRTATTCRFNWAIETSHEPKGDSCNALSPSNNICGHSNVLQPTEFTHHVFGGV